MLIKVLLAQLTRILLSAHLVVIKIGQYPEQDKLLDQDISSAICSRLLSLSGGNFVLFLNKLKSIRKQPSFQ
jgi:hypothetical protein